MKELTINSNEIIIQENLEDTIENKVNKLTYYLRNKSKKSVVTVLYNNHLIALDGNKMCAVHRVLQKQVNIIYLENKADFYEFYKKYNKILYDSRLLDWNKWVHFLNNSFCVKHTQQELVEKDYFMRSNNKVKLLMCLNKENLLSIDMEYKGLSPKTRKILGLIS